MDKLPSGLYALGLGLLWYSDVKVAVVRPGIANPLLFFNSTRRGAEYDGNIILKAINVGLYSATQIREALWLVNEYLLEEDSE